VVEWHPDVVNLFRDLDPIRWRQIDHNPIALLSEFNADRLGTARRGAGAL
jgi:starch phosphorylase